MKKAICGILIFAILASLVGCADIKDPSTYSSNGLFTIVHEEYLYRVVYDNQTKVMYVMSLGDKNKGTFTMLMEADGSPRIWRGE